ncbi:MAG: hypothetical protein CVT94_17930 [Bacteroidetes bacterium HGW-Bacteroidetes-11]|nr:MAG: hypothetical protein CVT94_17930 [Bacteroidetes bacterium HGW-Bacteroidetes-11]
MKKINLLLSIVIASGIVFSCSKSDDPDPTGDPGPKFLAVKAVISSNCATSGCHASSSSAGGLNFESNTVIVNNGIRIKSAAVDQGTMPPTGQLSAADKAKITDWINAGGRLTD